MCWNPLRFQMLSPSAGRDAPFESAPSEAASKTRICIIFIVAWGSCCGDVLPPELGLQSVVLTLGVRIGGRRAGIAALGVRKMLERLIAAQIRVRQRCPGAVPVWVGCDPHDGRRRSGGVRPDPPPSTWQLGLGGLSLSPPPSTWQIRLGGLDPPPALV